MNTQLLFVLLVASVHLLAAADLTQPITAPELVVSEHDGVIAIEAEHFQRQSGSNVRAWHITSSSGAPEASPDGDAVHVSGASGGAYIEALPDTRRTHDDKLINGENFSSVPGTMAVLHYRVRISTPGRYYVWARAYSTGAEDNGLHFGLDGKWPESGRRWQTVAKNGWHWDCKQRTEEVHTGVPMQLWLDVPNAGDHELLVGMREDGFELDKIVLAKSADFKPEGVGPGVKVAAGKAPQAFAFVAAAPAPTAAPAEGKSIPLALVQPRKADGDGSVAITGELKQWHKVTLTLDGPFAHERDNAPNPFTDLAFNVTFTHESGTPKFNVPGYFAADGDAANSGADSGTKWRAHLSPDKAGKWTWRTSFHRGKGAAVSDSKGAAVASFDGKAANSRSRLATRPDGTFGEKAACNMSENIIRSLPVRRSTS